MVGTRRRGRTPPMEFEELMEALNMQLNSDETRRILRASAMGRRVDLVLYIDRGISPKPPGIFIQ